METFAAAKEFSPHPHFVQDRSKALSGLVLEDIDTPIRDIVKTFGSFSHCYTLQCCYGHFLWEDKQDIHNLEALPLQLSGPIHFRIAYLALCIENSKRGRSLRDQLAGICEIDKAYVQFGSPGWFWKQSPNSYALQVEPARDSWRDVALLEHAEALHVQGVRDAFFNRVREILVQI